MERAKLFIIGLGNIGLPLLRQLSSDFQITCIDVSDAAFEQARKLRGDELTLVAGDATSRLVLQEAGVAEANAVVVATSSETVNIEVARVLHDHFDIPRVIAVGITQKGIAELEGLDVEVEGIFAISANSLRNRLEQRTKTVQGIGLGKNEILEVEVHPHSRLANKPLATLKPRNWNIGLIYRDGRVVVPRGNTVLKPRDRIVILGDPPVLKTIADRLAFRFRDFPLEYGDTACVYFSDNERDDYFAEIGYLLTTLPLRRVMVIHAPGAKTHLATLEKLARDQSLTILETLESPLTPLEAVRHAFHDVKHDPALVIYSREALTRGLFGKHRLKLQVRELLQRANCPIMLCAGTHPYERIGVPCVDLDSCPHALEKALEISSDLTCALEALMVRPSEYIASEEETSDYGRIRTKISDLGHLYRTSIKVRELEGNPIRRLTDSVGETNLLVTRLGRGRDGLFDNLLRPEVTWHVFWEVPVTSLLVPSQEASL